MLRLVLIFAFLSAIVTAEAMDLGPTNPAKGAAMESLSDKRAREAETKRLRELEVRLERLKHLRAGDAEAMEGLRLMEARLAELKERARRAQRLPSPCIGDCWSPGELPLR